MRLPCHAQQRFCDRTCSNRYTWAVKRPRQEKVVRGDRTDSRVWLKCAHCEASYWRHRGRAEASRFCSKACKQEAAALNRRGMSPQEYQARLTAQNGTCAICHRPDDRLSLARDHCHRTGAWRGLLCGRCNKALGLFRDDPALLRIAADYVEKGGVPLVLSA